MEGRDGVSRGHCGSRTQSANIWLSFSSRDIVRCCWPLEPVAAGMVGRVSAAAARSAKKRSNSEDEIVSSRWPSPG